MKCSQDISNRIYIGGTFQLMITAANAFFKNDSAATRKKFITTLNSLTIDPQKAIGEEKKAAADKAAAAATAATKLQSRARQNGTQGGGGQKG